MIDHITNGTYDYQLKKVKRVPSAFQRMKEFSIEYLTKLKGVIIMDEKIKNEMTCEVLEAVKFMLHHGFYND